MGLGASTPEVDVDRLNEAETEELNDVIVSLDLDAVRKAGDSGHWLSLMALAAHRAKDFSVSARARILRAINAGTIHYPEVQAVQSLLLSVWGAPLSLTKLAVDAGTATDDGGDSGSKAAAASEGSRGRGFAHLVLKRMPEPVRATLLHHFQAYGYRDTRRRVAAVSLPGSSTRGAIVASAAHVGSGGSASGVPGASLGSNHAQRAAVPKLQLLEDHFTPHRSRSMRGGVGDPGTPPVQQPSTNASRREQQLDRVVAGEQLPTPDTGAGAGAGAGVGAGSGAGSGASATAPNQISVSAGASLPPDGEHGGGAASAPTGDAAPTDSAGAGSADAEVAGTAAASSQAPRPVSAPGSSSGAHLPALVPPASMQPIKVFCDIDDTFYASLYDCSFRRNTVYPGARAFYHALRAGRCNEPSLRAGLVFLSARISAMRSSTLRMLRRRGAGANIQLLTGSAVDWVSSRRMAARKFRNFQQCVLRVWGGVYTSGSPWSLCLFVRAWQAYGTLPGVGSCVGWRLWARGRGAGFEHAGSDGAHAGVREARLASTARAEASWRVHPRRRQPEWREKHTT